MPCCGLTRGPTISRQLNCDAAWNLYICTCVCVCVCVCTHTYIHTYIHTHVYTYTVQCVCTHHRWCVCVCVCVCTWNTASAFRGSAISDCTPTGSARCWKRNPSPVPASRFPAFPAATLSRSRSSATLGVSNGPTYMDCAAGVNPCRADWHSR